MMLEPVGSTRWLRVVALVLVAGAMPAACGDGSDGCAFGADPGDGPAAAPDAPGDGSTVERDAGPQGRADEVDVPDVIIVTIDTLRADHVGCYGYEKASTPNIDRLAREGVRFEQATVPLPRTTPALASMMTGLWPHHHGAREVWEAMDNGITLAQVLSKRGYATRGVVANPTVGPKQSFDRGFDQYVPHGDIEPPVAEEVTRRALALAGHADPERPLFLWAHYLDPHWPYAPPKSWKPQPKAPECRKLRRRERRGKVARGQIQANAEGVSEPTRGDCTKLYDAEIAYNDHAVGTLLDGLRDLGRLDDAFVVFASDHGENLGEWGLWYEHGPSLHDASLRVPLIIKGPGIPAGRVSHGVARIEDVMPTLLSLLGTPALEQPVTDGRDLAPQLRGDRARPLDSQIYTFAENGGALHKWMHRYLISGREKAGYCYNDRRYALCVGRGGTHPKFFDHQKDPGLRDPLDRVPPVVKRRLEAARQKLEPETARQHAVRTPRFKLVERPQLDGSYERALYDLREPDGEDEDVSDRHPDVVERLGARLEAWRQTLPAFEAPERDEDDLAKLRALGYVE